MALLDELFEGSYNGRTFLIKTATTTGGRKQVKHDYPNSDKQKIEDLGLKPRNFKIVAIITGDNYLNRRDLLLQELEKDGEGTLSHPFFSSSFKVTPRNWSISEDTAQLGTCVINLDFDISDRFTSPTVEPTSVAEVQKKTGEVGAQLESGLGETVETKTPETLTRFQRTLKSFTDFTNSVVDKVAAVQDQIDAFTSQIDAFEDNLARLAALPTEMADSILSIISTVDALFQTFDSALDSYKKFFSFGDDEKSQLAPSNTTTRAAIANNTTALVDTTQAAYLAVAYQRVAEQEFTTVDEIEEVQQLLEQQYLRVRAYNLTSETLDTIADLRAIVQRWLEEQRINAAQVVEVETQRLPLSVLAYQYYGDNENFDSLLDVLVDLNRPQSDNLSYMKGKVKVLTQ